MKELRELEQSVEGAIAFLKTQPEIKSAQVFASANNRVMALKNRSLRTITESESR